MCLLVHVMLRKNDNCIVVCTRHFDPMTVAVAVVVVVVVVVRKACTLIYFIYILYPVLVFKVLRLSLKSG